MFLLMFAGAHRCASAAPASDNWYAYPQPYGGSLNFIRMWGDTGIACGAADYRTTNDGLTWQYSMAWSASSAAVDSGGRGWMSFTHVPSWTTDYGVTWNDFPTNHPIYTNVEYFLTGPGGKHFAVRASTPWESSPHVVFRSVNPDFNTWVARQGIGLPDTFQFNELAVSPTSGTLFLSAFDSGGISTTMFRSTDDGDHWQQMALTGIPPTESTIWGYHAIAAMNNGTLFTSTHHSVAGGWQWNNYRSTDDGMTWHACGNGLPTYAALWSPVQNAAGTIFATGLVEDATLVPHWTSVYQSTDNGMTWAEPPNAGLPPQWAMQLTITPRGTLIAHALTGQGGGVYRSTDNGATWSLSVTGLHGPRAVGIAVDSNANIFASIPESGLYRSRTGFAWTRLAAGIPTWGYMNLRPAPDKSIYAADTLHGVYHSTDQGDTWSLVSSDLPSLHMGSFNITPSGTLISFTDRGTYRSTNSGVSWTIAAGTIPMGANAKSSAVRGDGLIIATTEFGPYISTDDGEHWTLGAAGLTVPSCRGVGFTKDGIILMGNGGGVVRSSDNGMHWERSDDGVPKSASDHHDFSAFVVRGSGRIIGSRMGDPVFVYTSTDNGRSWTDGRTGNFQNFVYFNIPAFATDKKNNVYAATDNGVWYAQPEPNSVDEEQGIAPDRPAVIATPNPANASTSISVAMHHSGVASIVIIDELGREVYRTAPQFFDAGVRTVAINTAALPAGTYHCMVRGEGVWGSVRVGVVR